MPDIFHILFVLGFDDAHAAVECLQAAGFEVTDRRVRSAEQLRIALSEELWDAVVADWDLAELPGNETAQILSVTDLNIPLVVLSDTCLPCLPVNAGRGGISAYLPKSEMARLADVLLRLRTTALIGSFTGNADSVLRESEERFRSLIALSSDWYWEQDEKLRFTYISSATSAKYSEAMESWAGKTRWELPYCNTDWTDHRATVEAREPFHDVELQPFRSDGSITYISVCGEPKFDNRGQFVGYRGVGKDITERVKDAEALQKFRTAMDASLDSITLVSRTTMRFVEVNATAIQMLGYARTELLQMGPQAISTHSIVEIASAYDAMIAGDRRFGIAQTMLERKDGSRFHADVRQHAQLIGGDWIIVGVVRDHTERNESEKKLHRLNRLYATVSATNALVVRVRDREELFSGACELAVQHGEFEQAWLGIVDSNQRILMPEAWAGIDLETIESIKKLYSDDGDVLQGRTLAAKAIINKMAVVSNDVQNDDELTFGSRYIKTGIRSLAILPLIVSDQAIGAFALYTDQLEFFDAAGLQLLTELAGNVAFALTQLEKQERLDYLAYYDALTGLANRKLFLDRMAQSIRSASSGDHRLALLLIDVERFRKINDTLGRPLGDLLLQQIASWLVENVGDPSDLARIDADHFGIVFPQVADESEVARRLEGLSRVFLAHQFCLNEIDYRVAIKIGIALFPDDASEADVLFRNAEVALQKAKVGGDRYLFYAQKMTETVAGSLGLENRLRQALEHEEFVLYYQPKFHIVTGQLTGAEALMRWRDPQTGLVAPNRFIPMLEETGLIIEVGRWAMRRALEDYQRWHLEGLPVVRIAVNVSPLQLRDRGFVTDIQQFVLEFPTAACGLELELTETLIMEDVSKSIGSLLAIRALGVKIAIDDFGTGFSSLSYLARLPVDTLKIDRSFINDMLSSNEGLTLVSVIIDLAHALKLRVVAEGVETEEQRRQLQLLNCDEIQGYLLGRPVAAHYFEQLHLGSSADTTTASTRV